MKITGKTRITGVFGYPVGHSLSPLFQNAAFEYLKLDCVYIPMEVAPEEIGKAIEGVRALNFAGVNITIPHKRAVLKYLDEIDEEAKLLGAVNTVVNKNGKLKGYTTDGSGFARSLKESCGFTIRGKKVFILGSGGSSYAISGALAKGKVSRIYICNRTEKKAILLKRHLFKNLGYKSVEVVPFGERNDKKIWLDIQLLVNATSVGMKKGDPLLIDSENLAGDKFVYDIVYNRKTELLKAAEKKGLRCLDGLSMLIYQGAISFELWTGKTAPVEVMKRSVYL